MDIKPSKTQSVLLRSSRVCREANIIKLSAVIERYLGDMYLYKGRLDPAWRMIRESFLEEVCTRADLKDRG